MINELILEVHKMIPIGLKKKLQTKEFRHMLMEKFGPDAFLKPKDLKYPIYDESGFNCALCYAAYLRASQFHETEIAVKAKSLFNNNNCADTLNVHIGENQYLGFVDFTDLFEFQMDDLEFIEFI